MRELGAGWMPIHTTTREELVAGIAALPAGFEVRGDGAGDDERRWRGRRRRDT